MSTSESDCEDNLSDADDFDEDTNDGTIDGMDDDTLGGMYNDADDFDEDTNDGTIDGMDDDTLGEMYDDADDFDEDTNDGTIDGMDDDTLGGMYDDADDFDEDTNDGRIDGMDDETLGGMYDDADDFDEDTNDGTIDGMDDDTLGGMYDDDDSCDYDDINHLTALRDSILGTNAPSLLNAPLADIPADYSVQLAMNSKPEVSKKSNVPEPCIDDSLRLYLIAPPLVRRTADTKKVCLSIDPTADDSESKPLSTPELYIGNVPYNTNWFELRDWFNNLGYGVSRVQLKTNKKNVRFAFVRFDTIATAKTVLYISDTEASNFVFKGNVLDIKHRQRSPQAPVTQRIITIINKPASTSFEITDIYYGTLITGATMRNIGQRTNSIVSSSEEFGIIAHNLKDYDVNTSFTLNIDHEKKKLAIIGEFDLCERILSEISAAYKFEWNFQDLKGKKITPVMINQDELFLLVELKRPPIILETQNISFMGYDTTNETRLPGRLLIGHANAWLFRLSSNDLRGDYEKLFHILHRYNLTPRQFSGFNIIHLMSSKEAMKRNFISVPLIANEEWVKDNEEKVNNFFSRRWPTYPFETKFEIMKLISKHIITVNDLIVDEQAENILKLCSINALALLSDKILEFAPQWFGITCDNEDEDWDTENNQEQPAESEEDTVPIVTANMRTTTDALPLISHIRSSATGSSINITDAKVTSLTSAMARRPLKTSDQHLGIFSRLLISALEHSVKKSELSPAKGSGIFVTKLELRTANANSNLIRKIYITPSTIFYEGPYREEKCAVTREYEKYQDRFLRVTFRDEDYRVLHNYNDNMSKVYERIKDVLKTGINVCGRNYQFLAFSSSQLREHSCWMFASPDDDTTVDIIRNWMGDFHNIHPVAKYAARLGQLFSTSIKGIQLENNQFVEISDHEGNEFINGRLRRHCFTDGIGIISTRLAKKLAQEMRSSNKTIIPSAFQIRCGGYKGMVCVDVFNCIKHPNMDINFRPSMRKFIGRNFSIDVVRTSLNPSVAFLNRQIILLLSSLGIPNKHFIDLQDHMLKQLKALTENPKDAIQSLRDLNEFGGNGFHRFLIAYMKKLGKYKDPFVWRLLRTFKAFLVKELRTKAKIRVQDSWSLLGVVDESRTLQYGQVFIQIDNSHNQKEGAIKEILKGPVVVTRNPCFHPGDVRKLEAVDIPAFHSLKNVIVFPMNGLRPHPMEMSGGDLDGDTFWISRHPKLIFPTNEDPFDYQGQEDEAKENQSNLAAPHTISEVCNFFGEYIAADNLGLIANRHLVFADQSPDGPKDSKCLELARMHSIAVDFAKNGISAPQLTREFHPQEYPHYMEKRDKKSRHSETILGILYDRIECYHTELHLNEGDEINTTFSFPYKTFIINGTDDYMADARIMKNGYDQDVKRVMRQYGIRHEVEIVSGYILQFTTKQYAKETKLFDLRNEITHAYRVIQDKYLRLFWQEFYQSTKESDEEQEKWSTISKKLTWKNQIEVFERHALATSDEEVQKKASAWFRVTYEPWMTYIKKNRRNQKNNRDVLGKKREQDEQSQERFKGLFSFAWLVYPVLLRIFQENQDNSNNNTESKKKKKKKKKIPVSSNTTTRKV